MTFYCPFCHNPVDPTLRSVWQKESGWVQKRKGGGTHALALRQAEQEWAHPGCVMLAKDGLLGQERLG